VLRALARFIGSGLRRNVLAAVGQAIVAMLATFATYRAVIEAVGLELFGLWSVLLAGAGVARMADASGGSGLARFVAERLSRGNPREAVLFVHTVVLSGLGLMLVGCALVLAAVPPVLRLVIPEQADVLADLLPVVLLVSVLLPSTSAALCSGIDGTLRTDLRAILMSVSYAVLFLVSQLLLGPLGIYGFAAALAAQHLFLAVGAWIVLRSALPGLGWAPLHWSRAAFKESFRFGLKVQATGFAWLLSDPLARVLIAANGGATAAAFYELALRLVQQVRVLFVSAMQPLMPQVASLGGSGGDVGRLVQRAQRISIVAAAAYMGIVVAALPVYVRFLLDEPAVDLGLYAILLAIGYAINLLTVPLFLVGVGLGVMRWNLASQFLMAGCIAGVGSLAALAIGSLGIVLGQLVGLVAGAAMVGFGNAISLGFIAVLRADLVRYGVGVAVIGLIGLLGYRGLP